MTRLGWRRALIAIALGGLVLRVIYAYVIVRSKSLNGDALEFQLQANLLADGHGYIQPFTWQLAHIARPTADKPPVYASLEALISLFGGRSWGWHDLVDILAGTATIVVTGLLGRRVGGERLGLIAAGLAAVYPLLIATDGSLRSESVFALLVTLALLQALRLRETPSVKNAAVLGVIIALATLTRSEALLLVVLLPFGLAGLRRGLVTAGACALVLLPWFVRCWIAFDQPVLLSTNVGGLLAGANCAQTYSGGLIGQWTFSCIPPPKSTNEAQASNELRDIGLRYARQHASRLPVVIAARIGRSFELYQPAAAVDDGGGVRGAQRDRREARRVRLLRHRAPRDRRHRPAPAAARPVARPARAARACAVRLDHGVRVHALPRRGRARADRARGGCG